MDAAVRAHTHIHTLDEFGKFICIDKQSDNVVYAILPFANLLHLSSGEGKWGKLNKIIAASNDIGLKVITES